MPTVYEGRCDRCAYSTGIFPAEYGAVFVDKPLMGELGALANSLLAGAVLFEDPGEDPLLRQGDPRFVALAHPLEDAILKEAGYTWAGCWLAGRYVRVIPVVCRSCGTFFERCSLSCPGALGCLPGLLLGLIAGVIVGVWERDFCLGLSTAATAAVLLEFLLLAAGGPLIRLCYADRARSIARNRACPNCGGRPCASAQSWSTRLPCPRCSEGIQTIRTAGIS